VIFMMQQLIASYLFQFKTCPLPGLGTLYIKQGIAKTDFLNKAITPPVSSITFDAAETDAHILVDYIAAKKNISELEAIKELGKFCNELKAASNTGVGGYINDVGTIFTEASGEILFTQAPVPQQFLQSIPAERVIHSDEEHHLLVGDKETTNMQMAEYYTEDNQVKDRWWIWAIVLGVIGIIGLLIYFSDKQFLL
jgi:hypothetical protein